MSCRPLYIVPHNRCYYSNAARLRRALLLGHRCASKACAGFDQKPLYLLIVFVRRACVTGSHARVLRNIAGAARCVTRCRWKRDTRHSRRLIDLFSLTNSAGRLRQRAAIRLAWPRSLFKCLQIRLLCCDKCCHASAARGPGEDVWLGAVRCDNNSERCAKFKVGAGRRAHALSHLRGAYVTVRGDSSTQPRAEGTLFIVVFTKCLSRQTFAPFTK